MPGYPQVCPSLDKVKKAAEGANLVEVGPRACLNPILIFSGAFGGAPTTLSSEAACVSSALPSRRAPECHCHTLGREKRTP